MKKWNFHYLCHRYKEWNGGLKYKNLIFSWKYIVWPIKWLEISPGMWILSQNFETDISLRSICKYIQKLIFFNDFCKNFQGKFFLKGLNQFSTINCNYSYKSLTLRIFFNSYLVKAHCGREKTREKKIERENSACEMKQNGNLISYLQNHSGFQFMNVIKWFLRLNVL